MGPDEGSVCFFLGGDMMSLRIEAATAAGGRAIDRIGGVDTTALGA